MKNKTAAIGIVEGFFSQPRATWTFEERSRLLTYLGSQQGALRDYLYCPKDDPYITQRWDELYPEDSAERLTSMVAELRRAGFNVQFGLNPMFAVQEIDSAGFCKDWRAKIVKKLEQFLSFGVSGICLLFDDIPLAYDVVDNKHETAGHVAARIIEEANLVFEAVAAQLDTRMFCSADYCFVRESPWSRAIPTLRADVEVFWSGNTIFAPTVTASDVQRVQTLLGKDRPLDWWLNYPVNDCEHNVGEFNIGAFLAPEYAAAQPLRRIMANPMRECAANLPFLLSLAEYARNPEEYSRERAWENALRAIVPNAAPALQQILTQFSGLSICDPQARHCLNLFEAASDDAALRREVARLAAALSEVRAQKPATAQAGFFLNGIASLLQDAEWYLSCAARVLEGRVVEEAFFAQGDRFPTLPERGRYVTEVARIVAARIGIMQQLSKQKLPSGMQQNMMHAEEFPLKFSGQERVMLAGESEVFYRRVIADLIQTERALMRDCLNDANLSARDRLATLAKRQSLNRFSLAS